MARYLLEHRHGANECGLASAAWKGFESPLRRGIALASCLDGHAIWWNAEAPDARQTLELLPPYVAQRTTVVAVRDVAIP